MATSQAAYKLEQAVGRDDPAIITEQNVSTTTHGAGNDSGSMKALVWQAKNKVEVGTSPHFHIAQRHVSTDTSSGRAQAQDS